MFITLTHKETGNPISIKADSIDSVEAGRDGTVVRAGAISVTVSEQRKMILDLINKNNKGGTSKWQNELSR